MGARVILADSQTSFRRTIRALIESAEGYEVVAEASDGRELLACIQQHHPDVVVLDVALPLVDGPEVVRRAKASGHTSLFLLLSSCSGRAPLEMALEIAPGRDAPEARKLNLSTREQEVLRLIADGLSSKEIAEALHVSARTVDTHRWNLMQKLGVHKAVGLVRFAIREGLIDP